MNIGYACLTVGVPNTHQKSCTIKNASEDKLLELISHNLNSLENIINYNIINGIKLFRISSDLIPFGSIPVNNIRWQDKFAQELSEIGDLIHKNGIRVSMHPGQYTVLNSPNIDTVKRAFDDLNYHADILDCLGVGEDCKIILHIGGAYGDKQQAIKRFIDNYKLLDTKIRRRLVIENDDKSYNISEVLEIGSSLNIPVVFDNLHNAVNPSGGQESDLYWINLCKSTWQQKDGNQKIHYSQQSSLKRSGSHSQTIKINEFIDFYNIIGRNDIDLMLEVKDKNISAVKCINCITQEKTIRKLEIEWGKYKYSILEKSHFAYDEIRKMLKDKNSYPAVALYSIIENALLEEETPGNSVNAAMHVWGYFKDTAAEKEKDIFLCLVEKYQAGDTTLCKVKKHLFSLAEKYNQPYLLESYYWIY